MSLPTLPRNAVYPPKPANSVRYCLPDTVHEEDGSCGCGEGIHVASTRAIPASSAATNPRALGTNPRALGTNPRALGTNPRAVREAAEAAASTFVDMADATPAKPDVTRFLALADDAKSEDARARRRRMAAHLVDSAVPSIYALVRLVAGNSRDSAWLSDLVRAGELGFKDGRLIIPQRQSPAAKADLAYAELCSALDRFQDVTDPAYEAHVVVARNFALDLDALDGAS